MAGMGRPEDGRGDDGLRDEDKRDRDEADAELEEGLEENFPASDPPAVTNPSRPGVPIGEI